MSEDRDSAALAAYWAAWELARSAPLEEYEYTGGEEDSAESKKEDPAVKADEHRCWDHAERSPFDCKDFDYVCRFCGAPIRSDDWYKFQE